MGGRSDLLDYCVESVLVVSGVLHDPDGTVGLHERVSSLDHVSVALFVLLLDVSGVRVMYSVVESVLGVRLENNIRKP